MVKKDKIVVEGLYLYERMPPERLPPLLKRIPWSRLLKPGVWFVTKLIDTPLVVSIPFALAVGAWVAAYGLYLLLLPAGLYLLLGVPRAWDGSGRRLARAWNRVCVEEKRFEDADGRTLLYRAASSRPEDRS